MINPTSKTKSARPSELVCKYCGSVLSSAHKDCQSCGRDNGCPNVRLAESQEEQKSLMERLDMAEVSAKARNCKNVLDKFGDAVRISQAVIARSLASAYDLVDNGLSTYTSFQQQIAGGARAPNKEFDVVRTQFEAALFPNFHKDIKFACLSLDGKGLSGYGQVFFTLKEHMISERTTVFQENIVVLSKKLGLLLHDPLPNGYRATWNQRDILAKAKLHGNIEKSTQSSVFSKILLDDRGGTEDCDFIEVHVFGPFNRGTIKRVIGKQQKSRADQLLWKSLQLKLKEIGIVVEAA